MKRLDMGNATDDDLEKLIVFAESVARLSLYGSELSDDVGRGEDAMEALNSCIEEARALTGIDKPDHDDRLEDEDDED